MFLSFTSIQLSKEKKILVVVIIVQHYPLQMYLKSHKFLGKNLQKKAQNLIESSSLWNLDITEENILNTKLRTSANKV